MIVHILIALWLRFGSIDPSIIDQSRFASVTIVDRNSVVLYEPLAKTHTRGEHVSAKDLPPNVARAPIAAEDRRFYWHPGIDPVAIARATLHNMRHRDVVEGGSTITQQVAKLLLQSRDRSVVRKLRESVLALRLEHRYSKPEILAMYLTLAPYGNRITGISRASRTYFGCEARQLTIAQAAYLAALPQRPIAIQSKYALDRQRYVLAAMHAPKTAFDERLKFAARQTPVVAQHYIEHVLAANPRATFIRTSLDAGLQRDVLDIINANRTRLLKHGAHSVAVAVLDNRRGQWLAWEGSGDYFGDVFGGAIDGVVTLRQPGSALKPFTYALAFENGFTPETELPDVPTSFATAQPGIVYEPRNYDGRYRGTLSIRAALAGSENVPAVAMLAQLGAPELLRLLRSAGFTAFTKTADYYGLGLTLGDAEVRLDEMVNAYATFARGGVTTNGRRLFSPCTASWISDILSDSAAREYIFGSGGSLDFPFRVAVKTGTSQAYRDNWTIGFTRDVTVGVWVGNFDRSELRNSSGVTGAAPIFHSVMLAAVKRLHGALPIGDDSPIVDLECGAHGAAVHAPTEAPPLPHSRFNISNPPDGATYLIDPTLRMDFQTLRLKASSAAKWRIDGKGVEREWPLKAGEHVVEAIDREGNRDEVRIYVK